MEESRRERKRVMTMEGENMSQMKVRTGYEKRRERVSEREKRDRLQ